MISEFLLALNDIYNGMLIDFATLVMLYALYYTVITMLFCMLIRLILQFINESILIIL